GPKGPQPTFKFFTLDDPAASTYDSVRDFQGGAGNGWQPAPEGDLPEGSPEAELKADPDTARQTAVQDLIEQTNANVEDSSEELDVTNLDAKTYYTIQDGTEVAAIVISPKTPPSGSGLQRPDFAPVTSFAYRDPGNPYLPSILFLISSSVLFVVHMLLLGVVERRRPLGVAQTPAAEPERQPAGAGGRRPGPAPPPPAPPAPAGPRAGRAAPPPLGPVHAPDGPARYGAGGEHRPLRVGQDGEPPDRDVHGGQKHLAAQLLGPGRGPVGVRDPERDPPPGRRVLPRRRLVPAADQQVPEGEGRPPDRPLEVLARPPEQLAVEPGPRGQVVADQLVPGPGGVLVHQLGPEPLPRLGQRHSCP